jgi:hypothetical protein
MIEVDDTQHFESNEAAVDALLSWAPVTADEHTRTVALLPTTLVRNGTGWLWPRKGRIAVIWWDQPT